MDITLNNWKEVMDSKFTKVKADLKDGAIEWYYSIVDVVELQKLINILIYQASKIRLDPLVEYRISCVELGEQFAKKYFGKDSDSWWIADDTTGVFCVNDYFFTVSDMYEFLSNKYSKKLMFEYYDYAVEAREKNKEKLSIKNYKKLKNVNTSSM